MKVNAIRFSMAVVPVKDQDLLAETREGLAKRKADLENEEAGLQVQMNELQADLDRDYNDFLRSVDARITALGRAYERHGTAFLGVICRLSQIADGDRLMGLTMFVPEFDGSARIRPESCSEAQRFFLDIALRLALIDMAMLLAGLPATFICETPENALDASYVDNVVRMFAGFATHRHTLIFTANLQHQGLAQKIMASVAVEQRSHRVLNLLEVGHLSDVHKKAIKMLQRLARKVIK